MNQESILTGLIIGLALLTGFAFKATETYRKAPPYLFTALSALLLGYLAWHSGVETTWTSVQPYIASENMRAAKTIITKLQPFDDYWAPIVFYCCLCYYLAGIYFLFKRFDDHKD